MKKLFILILGLILSNSMRSQDYIPLLIDSSYTLSAEIDMFGDTIIAETWSGYSYDSNDSLIQWRNPNWRANYSYKTDTLLLLSETLDTSNNWHEITRVATAFANGKPISKKTDRTINGEWSNSAYHTYFYDSENLDTLYMLQHWKNGQWVNFYKKEKKFDGNKNNIEEAEFYADSNGALVYNRGKLMAFDTANHLSQMINTNISVNGPYYTARTNWEYGIDHLLDTIRRCNYSYPNDGTCTNVSMVTYDYKGMDTIIENSFSWSNDVWKYSGQALTFKSNEIYSNKPDSVITYYYLPDSLDQIPIKRRFLAYEDLGDDTIYFKEEQYRFYTISNAWFKTLLKEEWYQVKPPGIVDDTTNNLSQVLFFPNPSSLGVQINLTQPWSEKSSLEILVFDINGRMVLTKSLNRQASFQGPSKKGVYTILIREEGRLVGVSKQVIIE